MKEVLLGILIPFIGTTLGASMVYLMKNKINNKLEKILLGFAGGVMLAASIWSLIIPAIEQSSSMSIPWLPASIGLAIGFAFLLLLDTITPHLHINSNTFEGKPSKLKKATMMMLAVTLHNIPEGMAVGVTLAGAYYNNALLTFSGALALSIGIAIQNFPEGAIISLPLKEEGLSKNKAFIYGMLSGIVEPIFAFLTFFFSGLITNILPYILSFAAGAMIYVIIEEIIPESQTGKHTNLSTIGFAIGFILMMILDIALG